MAAKFSLQVNVYAIKSQIELAIMRYTVAASFFPKVVVPLT
jgi:hypothetical protein